MPDRETQQHAASQAAMLELVRSALVTGVLLIAVVAFVIHRGASPQGDADLPVLRRVVYVLMAAAVVGSAALHWSIERAATTGRAVTLTILAWCIAETPALAGAFYYLITGSAGLFAQATLLFVAVLLFTGIPESVSRPRLSSP